MCVLARAEASQRVFGYVRGGGWQLCACISISVHFEGFSHHVLWLVRSGRCVDVCVMVADWPGVLTPRPAAVVLI